MKELTKIQEAVTAALVQAGLPAMAAFPAQPAKDHPGAVAAVSVQSAEDQTLGFCNYLGQEYDEEAGTVRELYGKQLGAVIAVEVRARSAADCQAGCETAAEVLLGELPSGIRSGELCWEGLSWEKETEMFLRRGRLQCTALFLARESEDGSAFTDFILKGVMQIERNGT